ncbi:MAG: hypothetical protein KDB80_13775, partial [Planctomycetes bacterium]|nr:hypothetical protein [Planctomycetota bacterium]
VTNTNATPMTPTSFGGSTNVHFEYYNMRPNPADPFRPLDCAVFDRVEFLTPADTLCVLTSCHNATFGPQEGYVVVTAQSPYVFDEDWCFDHLIGSELVVNASGVVFALNAAAFRCVVPPAAPCPGVQPCNGDMYERLPSVLMADSFLALAGSQLAMISGSSEPTDVRHLYFEVWNDNEIALSATRRFNCWFDQPLTVVSPLFSNAFLASTANAPDELDINCDGIGDVETGWFRVRTTAITNPDGTPAQTDDVGILGAITAGVSRQIDGGRLLWQDATPFR